jgi:hypothetical protein
MFRYFLSLTLVLHTNTKQLNLSNSQNISKENIMAALPSKLTLASYLQRWDANTNTLSVHLLVMPTGSPLNPLGTGLPVADPGPAFADSNLVFKAFLSKNWQQMPGFSDVDTNEVLSPAMPANRQVIFNELAAQFKITKLEVAPERTNIALLEQRMVHKHLMSTYTNSFAFVAPKTKLASTDDTYACLLNCPPKTPPTPKPIDDSVSWAEALSFALRQPRLAREIGCASQSSRFAKKWRLVVCQPRCLERLRQPNQHRRFFENLWHSSTCTQYKSALIHTCAFPSSGRSNHHGASR